MKRLDIGIASLHEVADEFFRTARAVQKGMRVRAREQLYFR